MQVARARYVLLWYWAAAAGAGIFKSDDCPMSVARPRCSYDIHYETEYMELLMNDAQKIDKSSDAGTWVQFFRWAFVWLQEFALWAS